MDRDGIVRLVVAMALSVLVLVGWTWLFPPPKPKPRPEAPAAEEAAAETGEPSADATGAAAAATTPGAASAGDAAPAGEWEKIEGEPGQEPVTLETKVARLKLSPRGGRVLTWKLPRYELVPGQPDAGVVDLVSPAARALHREPLTIEVDDPALREALASAWYVLEIDEATPGDRERLGMPGPDAVPRILRARFRYADGKGLAAEKTLYLPDDESYLAWVEWDVRLAGRPLPAAMVAFGPGIGQATEAEQANRYAYRGRVVAALPGGIERYRPGKVDGDVHWTGATAPRWIALDSQYFAIALVPREQAPLRLRLFPADPAHGRDKPALGIDAGARSLAILAGPKAGDVLEAADRTLGVDLRSLVNWGFFGFLAHPLYLALRWLYGVVGNWGWAIVIITVIIRLLFFPLTHRSMVKMRKTQQDMARLQPKIRKLKEKYRDKRDVESRRKMNEEMMELYRREGVNPAATLTSCLPMLLQLPVLYAMYTVLTVSIELRGAPFFGWIRDLSAMDPYYVTPIVMGVTMLAQQLMTMTKTEDPQQKSQQRMMLFMPIMFTWFFLKLPSGLVVYWLTNNVLGIVQQVLINRHAEAAVAAAGSAPAKKK